MVMHERQAVAKVNVCKFNVVQVFQSSTTHLK